MPLTESERAHLLGGRAGQHSMNGASQPRDDLDDLRALLTVDAERLATTLLGQPTKGLSTKKTLRFGSNGSLAVELRGRKRGEWFSHDAACGG